MSDADLVFLPWVRRGAAAALLDPDSFGPNQPGVAASTASITINTAQPASVPIRVMGPGYVTGLDRRQIIRTDPAPGSTSFEPNYFPLVEMDEPALPWLFTPAGAGAQNRLRPWLCLVVVRVQDGVRLDPPTTGPLPVLRIDGPAKPADELPNLDDSWAWAHGQVTSEAGVTVEAQLTGNPERTVSRLLCSRILQPDTEYLACVVPTFDLGCKAGLGHDITAADESKLPPAWTQSATSVELPVYYSWSFATGAGGDFQSLAMLLRARPLPRGIGVQPIDVSRSGLAVDIPAGTSIPIAGALQPVGSSETGWPSAALQKKWEDALRPVLNAPAEVMVEEDPLLAPPLYGASHAKLPKLDPVFPTRWFEHLNLSPEYRAIARLGTRVVQEQQEALMASAWEQAAQLQKVNQLLRQTQLGWRVAMSLHSRYFEKMDPGIGLQVLAPAQPRMLRRSATLTQQITSTGIDSSAYSIALRRVARPRGAISRRVMRVSSSALPATIDILAKLQPVQIMSRIIFLPTGAFTLERVATGITTNVFWSEATAAAVTTAPKRPFFAFVPMGAAVPMTQEQLDATNSGTVNTDILSTGTVSARTLSTGATGTASATTIRAAGSTTRTTLRIAARPIGSEPPEPPEPTEPPPRPPHPPLPPRIDSEAAKIFRQVAAAQLARFIPGRIVALPGPMLNGKLSDAFAEALARTSPTETFAIRAQAVFTLPGAATSQAAVPGPVGLSPAFPQPMIEPLVEIAQEAVLPGLDLVPANTIVPLETNTRFVQAYMVGLNTEMGRELLWRDFPADLSATYFNRFWDNSAAPSRPPDIDPISDWKNRQLGQAATDENFVMLVRSELLRRYPDAIVYAKKGTEERHPIFTGGFAPDIRYFGFDIDVDEISDWSIVIQEHPSAPRFGVEVGTDNGAATHVPPPKTDAALVAHQVRQMPVRITIPATVLGLT
jgi:hypothetical protein